MKYFKLIFCVSLLLVSVCFSGCQEKNNNDENQQPFTNNKFIGDWVTLNSSAHEDTWSFYANGSVINTLTEDYEDTPITTIVWFEYTNDNTTICFSTKSQSADSPDNISVCLSYRFSENATRLTLSSNGIVIRNLMKMS